MMNVNEMNEMVEWVKDQNWNQAEKDIEIASMEGYAEDNQMHEFFVISEKVKANANKMIDIWHDNRNYIACYCRDGKPDIKIICDADAKTNRLVCNGNIAEYRW